MHVFIKTSCISILTEFCSLFQGFARTVLENVVIGIGDVDVSKVQMSSPNAKERANCAKLRDIISVRHLELLHNIYYLSYL